MIRRCTIAVCALLVGVGLASCATFTRNDVAATVDDAELSQDELQEMLESDLAAQLLQFVPGDDEVSGDVARGIISVWIRLEFWRGAVTVPAGVTQLVEQQATAQFGDQWTAAPESLRELVIADGEIGTMIQDGSLNQEELLGLLGAADITVDARYGAWSDEQSRVVGLG